MNMTILIEDSHNFTYSTNFTHHCMLNESSEEIYCEYTQMFALLIVIMIISILILFVCLCERLFDYVANRAVVRNTPPREYVEMY